MKTNKAKHLTATDKFQMEIESSLARYYGKSHSDRIKRGVAKKKLLTQETGNVK